MIVCKKKRCVWRVRCSENRYYCFKAGNCPYVTKVNEKLPAVKWASGIDRIVNCKFYESKRNINNEGDTK